MHYRNYRKKTTKTNKSKPNIQLDNKNAFNYNESIYKVLGLVFYKKVKYFFYHFCKSYSLNVFFQ